MTARCVMVLGTSSGAGKSWIATALCRHYANQGLKVAPFKAQNMSNNARVVAPTLPASHGALPPEGAVSPWGGPAGRFEPPRSPAAHGALPPEGAVSPWGGPAAKWAGQDADAPWGEIGSAQYFQALAARAEPDVRMNPLLLKPVADTRSQVVLMGQVDHALGELPWRGRSAVRVLYTGAALLLLAYVGSRFALEVVLGRSV